MFSSNYQPSNYQRWALCAAFAALLCAPAIAQPGAAKLVIDTEAATGGLQNLGVQYLGFDINNPGEPEVIIVTGRGNTAVPCGMPATSPYVPGTAFSAAAPHTMYAIDVATGMVVRAWCQNASNATSAWGHRDMATDYLPGQIGTNLIFTADETGLYCYDRYGNEQTGAITYFANGGVQISTASYPLTGFAPNGNARGLAFDAYSNGGAGSFFTANFASDLVEFDINGAAIGAPYMNTSGWSVYGLAIDRERTAFAQSQGLDHCYLWASTSPNQGNLAEILVDRTAGTATETGRVIARTLAGAQGGLSMAYGRTTGAGAGSRSELCVLTQGGTGGGLSGVDGVAFQRLDLYDPGLTTGGSGFGEEIEIVTSVNGGTADSGPKGFLLGDSLSWGYRPRAGSALMQAGAPGVFLANLPPDAGSSFNTLGIPELLLSNPFSMPAATAGASFVLADGLALGLPALGIGPNAVGDPDPVFPFNVPLLAQGDVIRLQAFVADLPGAVYPGAPFPGYATNVCEFTYNGAVPPLAILDCVGANNFTATAAAPFWTLTNNDPAGRTIVSVTVATGGFTGNFDFDQAMGPGTMTNGNSAVAGCTGTIAIDPGLDYSAATSAFGPGATSGLPVPCDPAAFSGWDSATLPAAGTGAVLDLTFTFQAGMFGAGGTQFAWNMDTDGGAGTSGSAMAGITVTITWDDMTTSTGSVAAAGTNGQAQIF